jgi:hypothetical protein
MTHLLPALGAVVSLGLGDQPAVPPLGVARPTLCLVSAVAARLRDQVVEMVTATDVDDRARASDLGLRPVPADSVRIVDSPAVCASAARAYAAQEALAGRPAVRPVAVVRAGGRYIVHNPDRTPGSEWTTVRVFTRDFRPLAAYGG